MFPSIINCRKDVNGIYRVFCHGKFRGGYNNLPAGTDAETAASYILTALLHYCVHNKKGWHLHAPKEVLSYIPEDLHMSFGNYNASDWVFTPKKKSR